MAAITSIEWTDVTWNPVTGCDKVSPGCAHCYAGRIAESRLAHLPQYADGFFGNVQVHHDKLYWPLTKRKPCRIFVNSMSDLFHDDVPLAFIQQIFSVMRDSQHVFQILTKRPERMRDVINSIGIVLPNVWLGISVEDQQRADDRIPTLLDTPASIHWISAEPLLGPIELSNSQTRGLDWIVCGGETGPRARPMDPNWAKSIRDQCIAIGIPFFFKGWGGTRKNNCRTIDGKMWEEFPIPMIVLGKSP